MKIAIFLPNWIGDVVMATPALRAIRARYRDAHLIGLARPYVRQVLEGTDWFDESWAYDRRSDDRNLRTWTVARRLRASKLEMAILMPNSLSSAWTAWLSGARRRVGFGHWGRQALLTDVVGREALGGKSRPYSAVDHYAQLAEAAGCPVTNKRLELRVSSAAQSGADKVWKNFGWTDENRVVALNTGSAGAPAKNWPITYFKEVAQRLVDEFQARVLVLCGPKERDSARAIVEHVQHPFVQGMHDQDLSLSVMMGCIARSQLLISTDSGPRHFAAAFSVPTVAIFGSIDRRWSQNYNPHEIGLQRQLACGPCGKKDCPLLTYACLHEINTSEVLESGRRLLNKQAAIQGAA